MTNRTVLLLACMPAIPQAGSAQHIVEIDYSAGRTILQDEWRAIRLSDLAADWDRNLLYVHDPEEPDGIMVFSLETGEWVRTISTPRGDGPTDLTDMGRCMRGGKPCPPWSHATLPSTDEHGNLVLTTGMEWFVAAAVIDPGTGCYALVRKDPEFSHRDQVAVRVRADSALVLQLDSEVRAGGVRHINAYGNKASMYPLRHVSGPPCPGMLGVPSAPGSDDADVAPGGGRGGASRGA